MTCTGYKRVEFNIWDADSLAHVSMLKRNTGKFNVSQEILQFTEKGSKAS